MGWFFALLVAALQISVAIFATYSSSINRISEGACLGGAFGTLANLVILAVAVVWLLILAAKSFKKAQRHAGLKPLSVLVLSSIVAIIIGLNAALGCTV